MSPTPRPCARRVPVHAGAGPPSTLRVNGSLPRASLTLVHFSAQSEHFLWDGFAGFSYKTSKPHYKTAQVEMKSGGVCRPASGVARVPLFRLHLLDVEVSRYANHVRRSLYPGPCTSYFCLLNFKRCVSRLLAVCSRLQDILIELAEVLPLPPLHNSKMIKLS